MSHVIHAHPAFWIQNFHFFWRTLRCSHFSSFSWGVVAFSSEHKLFTCIVIHFHWIRCDFQAYISVTSETIEMTRWWLFQSCSRLNGKHNDDIGQHQHQFHFNESERIGKKKSANRFIFILNCVVHLKRPEILNILKFLCHFCFFPQKLKLTIQERPYQHHPIPIPIFWVIRSICHQLLRPQSNHYQYHSQVCMRVFQFGWARCDESVCLGEYVIVDEIWMLK